MNSRFQFEAGLDRARPTHRYWLHALLLLLTLATTTVVGSGLARSFAASRPFDFAISWVMRKCGKTRRLC